MGCHLLYNFLDAAVTFINSQHLACMEQGQLVSELHTSFSTLKHKCKFFGEKRWQPYLSRQCCWNNSVAGPVNLSSKSA